MGVINNVRIVFFWRIESWDGKYVNNINFCQAGLLESGVWHWKLDNWSHLRFLCINWTRRDYEKAEKNYFRSPLCWIRIVKFSYTCKTTLVSVMFSLVAFLLTDTVIFLSHVSRCATITSSKSLFTLVCIWWICLWYLRSHVLFKYNVSWKRM